MRTEPAFPIFIESKKEYEGIICQSGMTLLDYFAGQTLIGFMSRGISYQERAKLCYEQAEVMIKMKKTFEERKHTGSLVDDDPVFEGEKE